MKDKDYIRITNLVKLRLMKQLLTDLVTTPNIDDKEYTDVYNLIDKWIDKHSSK